MKFVAFERQAQGTGASRRLRRAGKVPGIVYGGNAEPQAIELDHNALWQAVQKEAFHTSILEMELGGQTTKVVLRAVQYHPFKPQVLHVDFQRVDENTRLRKKVPLHFVNAENSPAVKADKCLINHVATELEIECLATQLPDFIEVDLGNLHKGQSLHVSDLKLAPGVKVVTHGKPNPTIATVVEPVEEVVAAPTAAPADDKKGKKGKK
ncbi:LSU ribosomal protein L25P [Tepidimonas ignava]|jgi:large subunit ribosomal protein L25|uniref:Large ribosomal subunit protein bL25 n=1 Tax=Tepidimonas ignava TaxID=114249 RepID=A0A4R3LC06_9BURK|nr:50S ribosomal protein L25/general stress protein Ctc [Tepidimonas ignava]TCS97302.1 LSU ribosomal protein L25P [Tepidimonas ignava]TSE21288.1 50S ribosomal protein L25 [Tepidimonas ignava]